MSASTASVRRSFAGVEPSVSLEAWLAPGSFVIGDVTVDRDASIWYGAVLRGDDDAIVIASMSNIQDGSILHADNGLPVLVGSSTTVGHRVILHGCRVGERCLVGMGAVVLDDAEIGADSIIAAGSIVTAGTTIPAGVLAVGAPARVKRDLTDAERGAVSKKCNRLRRTRNAAPHGMRRMKATPGSLAGKRYR